MSRHITRHSISILLACATLGLAGCFRYQPETARGGATTTPPTTNSVPPRPGENGSRGTFNPGPGPLSDAPTAALTVGRPRTIAEQKMGESITTYRAQLERARVAGRIDGEILERLNAMVNEADVLYASLLGSSDLNRRAEYVQRLSLLLFEINRSIQAET